MHKGSNYSLCDALVNELHARLTAGFVAALRLVLATGVDITSHKEQGESVLDACLHRRNVDYTIEIMDLLASHGARFTRPPVPYLLQRKPITATWAKRVSHVIQWHQADPQV